MLRKFWLFIIVVLSAVDGFYLFLAARDTGAWLPAAYVVGTWALVIYAARRHALEQVREGVQEMQSKAFELLKSREDQIELLNDRVTLLQADPN